MLFHNDIVFHAILLQNILTARVELLDGDTLILNLELAGHCNSKLYIRMPLPSSKNIGRKLGKGTATIIEDLKREHEEELAKKNEEHAKKVQMLEDEVAQCREEIEELRALSDEREDKFMPLPSPYQSLKYVKNTVRKPRRPPSVGDRNAANRIAELKAQHKKELTKAAEAYAKKLQVLKMDVDKFKAETEALRASGNIDGPKQACDSSGVSMETGVAVNDKENAVRKKAERQNVQPLALTLKRNHKKGTVQSRTQLQHQSGNQNKNNESGGLYRDRLGHLKDKYERFFRDDYQIERNPEVEEVLALGNNVKDSEYYVDDTETAHEEINELCKDLTSFLGDIKLGDVKIKKLGFC
mmetsp:Transcript_32067/g.67840  ORF Transcript_32067/g.67840 Transcript_32067/m.67840 type:complete len:355 (+) Transcript_32067:12-1076(+)